MPRIGPEKSSWFSFGVVLRLDLGRFALWCVLTVTVSSALCAGPAAATSISSEVATSNLGSFRLLLSVDDDSDLISVGTGRHA